MIELKDRMLYVNGKLAPEILQFTKPTDKCCLDCFESFGCCYDEGKDGELCQKTYCRIFTEDFTKDTPAKAFYTFEDDNVTKLFFCPQGRSLNGIFRNSV